jgi:hypothetical protein
MRKVPQHAPRGAEPGAEPGAELGAVLGAEPRWNLCGTGVCVVPHTPLVLTALGRGDSTLLEDREEAYETAHQFDTYSGPGSTDAERSDPQDGTAPPMHVVTRKIAASLAALRRLHAPPLTRCALGSPRPCRDRGRASVVPSPATLARALPPNPRTDCHDHNHRS